MPSARRRSITLRRIYSLGVMHSDCATRSIIGGNVLGQRACKRFGKRPGLDSFAAKAALPDILIVSSEVYSRAAPTAFLGKDPPKDRASAPDQISQYYS